MNDFHLFRWDICFIINMYLSFGRNNVDPVQLALDVASCSECTFF